MFLTFSGSLSFACFGLEAYHVLSVFKILELCVCVCVCVHALVCKPACMRVWEPVRASVFVWAACVRASVYACVRLCVPAYMRTCVGVCVPPLCLPWLRPSVVLVLLQGLSLEIGRDWPFVRPCRDQISGSLIQIQAGARGCTQIGRCRGSQPGGRGPHGVP